MLKPCLLIFFGILLVTPAWGDELYGQLQVRGDAVVEAPADQAGLTIGLRNSAATAEDAIAENSQALRRVEKTLLKVGLQKGEYRTGQFRFQPTWSSRPRDAKGDWRPKIVGYSVSNSFRVTTDKLKLLGTLIEAAAEAGANEIGQISFSLADEQGYRQRAIQQATAKARQEAKILGDAAGVKLDRLLKISLDPIPSPVAQAMVASPMAMRSMAAGAAPPIVAPDDIEVRAAVQLIYAVDTP